jgi:hypothetical protein
MAIKGIGFNDSSIKNQTIASGDTLAIDGDISVAEGIAVTAGGVTVTAGGLTVTAGDASFGANVDVSGNLNVTGDIVSGGSQNVVIKDPAIDLGVGATAAQTTGFSFVADQGTNVNTISSITSSTGTIVCSAATSIAAGDLIQISGSSDSANDGIYAVDSVSSPNIVIDTSTTNIGKLPFVQTAFNGNGTGGTVSQVNLKALVVAGASKILDGGGSAYAEGTLLECFAADATVSDFTANGSYSQVGGGATSLQDAYDTGATITTASSTDLALTLSSGDFTASGTGAVLLTPTAASSFTSGGALTLTGGAASTWSTSAGALTLDGASGVSIAGNAAEIDLTTTGALDLNSGAFTLDASTASIDSTDTTNLTMTASDAGAKALTISASNGGAGAASIDIVTAAAGDTVNINASGNGATVIGNASANDITIDSAGIVSIDAADTVNLTMATNDASTKTLTIAASNADVSNKADIDVDADGDILIDAAGAISLGAAAASDFTVAGADLVLQTTTTGDITANAVDTLTLKSQKQGVQAIVINSEGGTGGEVIIQNNGTTHVTVDTNGFALNAGVSVASILDQDDMSSDSATALATQQSIKAYVDNSLQEYQNITQLADGSSGVLAAGDVVAINGSGQAIQADASTESTCRVIGLCVATGGGNISIAQIGNITGLSGLTAGNKLYVSTTAGALTSTAPSASGEIIFLVGYATSTTAMVLAPQFITEIG